VRYPCRCIQPPRPRAPVWLGASVRPMPKPYRCTSLIRNRLSVGPYSRTMPMFLGERTHSKRAGQHRRLSCARTSKVWAREMKVCSLKCSPWRSSLLSRSLATRDKLRPFRIKKRTWPPIENNHAFPAVTAIPSLNSLSRRAALQLEVSKKTPRLDSPSCGLGKCPHRLGVGNL
jgi:hypothetical protein